MVRQFTCAVITDLKGTLQTGSRTFLFRYYVTRYIAKHRIEAFHVHAARRERFAFTAFAHVLRQLIRFGITLLLGNVSDDRIYLRRINERTLHTSDARVAGIKAVTATDELFRSLGVEHGARVDDGLRAQRDTGRDIRLDDTRDDVHGRTLGSKDHVHSHGARFLGDSRDRCLHLLAGLHDEIAVLINDDDDVWQELVMQAVRH